MNSTALQIDPGLRPRPQIDRARAFDRARAHSRRVRGLRRIIIAGSVLAIAGFLGALIYNPFRDVPGNLSISSTTLNGTRVTMELPKLSGFRADGKPYEVRARSGVQDIRQPKVLELNGIEARFRTADDTEVKVSAPRGVYDSSADTMNLSSEAAEGRIRITSSSGYDINLRSAFMHFKDGTMRSDEPVTVRMTANTISADRLDIAEKGSVVIFSGNVRSTIVPDRDIAAEQAKDGK